MDTSKQASPLIRLLQVFGIAMSLFFSSSLIAANNYYSGVFEFQKKLANNGNSQAQYKLANMYENGHGVKRDINQAMQWYKKSAANNYKMAGLRLTYLEIRKSGYKSAKHKPWLKELNKEAKKGNSEALFLIGQMHEKGIVVKKDLYAAKRYYKKASSRGNIDAETSLYEVEAQINEIEDRKHARAQAAKKAQQNASLQKAETARLAKEKQNRERLAREKKLRADNAQKSSQLKLEKERQQLKIESDRIAAEQRKLEEQQRALALQSAEAEEAETDETVDVVEEVKEEAFESDLCTGRAARFRTQCR